MASRRADTTWPTAVTQAEEREPPKETVLGWMAMKVIAIGKDR